MEKQTFDIYKVYDEEWEGYMGKGMVVDFAKQRATDGDILSCYSEEELEDYKEEVAKIKELESLIGKPIELFEELLEKAELSFNLAVKILDMNGYNVETLTLY